MFLNCGVGEDCQKIDVFELWGWRRLLRVPWTARRSNQSILKEISPGCSLEGKMLKLKLQYFGHIMQRTDSLEKTLRSFWLRAGGKGDGRGWDGWMVSLTQWTDVWVDSRSWWWTGRPGVLWFMGSQVQTRLSNWTELRIQNKYETYRITGTHKLVHALHIFFCLFTFCIYTSVAVKLTALRLKL